MDIIEIRKQLAKMKQNLYRLQKLDPKNRQEQRRQFKEVNLLKLKIKIKEAELNETKNKYL